jgi:sulfoxide reductase heme-binding subunit YedZ
MTTDRAVRWILKPLLFSACLLPLARLVAGAAGWGNVSLGANPVDAILDTLGKWTLNFLLITLCVTPLRELSGLNALLRVRRMLGLFAFTYAALHFTTYLWLDQSLDLAAVVEDIAKRPYITIGFTALLLLTPLAITSTNRMMRRLGRRWQKLHRLVYVIAILGVWHFYWQVKADVREPLWYAAGLMLLLGYRAWRRRRHSVRAPRAAHAQPSQSLPG